jgi:putative PIN family toxin of toxin-antitoxin system
MEKENKSGFRVVPDTNVIISAELSKNQDSPNRDFIECWLNQDFLVLFSDDTLMEYAVKLRDKDIPDPKIVEFLANLFMLGHKVEITTYHLENYPEDEDDICFVLCAENGNATHLISYDKHLLILEGKFKFEILPIISFLHQLRLLQATSGH